VASEKIFDVTIPEGVDPERGFKLAREKAGGVGITLEGDTENGTFSGTAEGVYRREGDRLRFEVTKKPFFVTWTMIESGLKKMFGDVTTA
jgi:hypothetical protein